jgi:transcriptional regulator with XRE-family HTH domain
MKREQSLKKQSERYAAAKSNDERRFETGERIRRCREKAGYTQKKLAIELEVDSANVGRWERGEQGISEQNLKKVADCLNTTVDYLLNGHSEEEAMELAHMILKLSDDLIENLESIIHHLS